MKSNSHRYRRHRNPEAADKQEGPFFSPRQKDPDRKNAFFQPKLNIGQAGDKYEKEADAVANKVVNQPSGGKGNAVQKKEITPVSTDINKKDAPKKEEEKATANVQKKDAPKKEEEKPNVQKKGDPKKEEEKPGANVQKKDAPKKEEEKPNLQKKDDPKQEEEKAGANVQKKDATKKEEEKPNLQKKDDPKKEEEKPGANVQKKDAPKKEEEKPNLQKKEEQERKPAADEVIKEEDKDGKMPAVQKREAPNKADSHEQLGQRLEANKNGGAPLPPQVQQEMSQAIGADFSNVRIHDNAASKEMSQGIGAQAFTNGNNIYFDNGKYDTSSTQGKHLLAHELTHVVQQGAAPAMNAKSDAAKSSNAPNVQRETSTPIPEGAVIDESKVARFKNVDGRNVTIHPDRQAYEGEDLKGKDAVCDVKLPYTYQITKDGKGRVTKVDIVIGLEIQTIYKPGVSSKDPSKYGRGAIKADKDKSLGFHEGNHGIDAMAYITANKLPGIDIPKPISEERFKKLLAAFVVDLTAYKDALLKESEKKTDEVKDPEETAKPEAAPKKDEPAKKE
ncbi:uncharacterized protein DUF4157 [Chitinophaga skermanii]|uniref:Uncharacterized protein DUF4157 n=1 Tax=Chitinophaga skermanii TaxID=331697 RepID=A0A327QQJ0_9BACT|nr:DUF4157 domain-containing protein [Chitinophaga skermanii]RAJ06521.1 uncharacterized protein DUF4157 [Chitinophaga skermanii]